MRMGAHIYANKKVITAGSKSFTLLSSLDFKKKNKNILKKVKEIYDGMLNTQLVVSIPVVVTAKNNMENKVAKLLLVRYETSG